MKLWIKILAIINANLSLVLFFTGPAYQVIDDQRIERHKLGRKTKKEEIPNLVLEIISCHFAVAFYIGSSMRN